MNRESLVRFRKEVLGRKNLGVMAIFILLSLLLDRLWILQYPGIRLMQAVDREKRPVPARNVVVVTIGPEEYDTIFHNRSPLCACGLAKAVDDIWSLGPRLVAVDIDTTDKSFKAIRDFGLQNHFVWARGTVIGGDSSQAAGFLGDGNTVNTAVSPYAGIAGFERDPDWTVRRLQGCVTLGGIPMPTFHHAIFTAAGGRTREECEERELPGAAYHFQRLALKDVEAAAEARRKAATAPAEETNLLAGKIVLLGGAFNVADYHPGPNGGLIPGVELVASAVEAQFTEAHSRLAERVLGILVDVLLGILVLWIYLLNKPPFFKLLVSVLLAGVFLFVPGVLFYYFNFWTLNPFLLVFGMMMDQMYEASKGHPRSGLIHTSRRVTKVVQEQSIHVEQSSSSE